MTSQTVICPTCGRTLTPRRNKFGDAIYPRHNMARLSDYDTIRHTPEHIGAELEHRVANPDAIAIYEMPCPLSGQPVED